MQKSASFERNFSEYQISRAKLAEEFVILNDGKICDLIGRGVVKFLFNKILNITLNTLRINN